MACLLCESFIYSNYLTNRVACKIIALFILDVLYILLKDSYFCDQQKRVLILLMKLSDKKDCMDLKKNYEGSQKKLLAII